MPATIEAPPDTGTDPFADLIGAQTNAPDYGAFGDLVPKDSFSTGTKQAGADFGQFSDLVPQSPTSETEKAVAETPDTEKMSDLERLVLGLSPKKPAETSVFHQTLNAVRSLAAGAGKYIYEGLQALKDTQASYLEDTAMSAEQRADYLKLPDGSALSKEQQVELEKKYHDAAIADVPDAKAQADLFKQLASNTDTALYVDPALADTIPARLAHAAGQASIMAVESLLPRIGVPLMVYHGALATQSEYQKAHPDAPYSEAEDAGTRSGIGLALFGGASKLAALGVARMLPAGAGPMQRFLTQFLGQADANMTSSRAVNAWEAANEAEPGKKIEAALNALKDTSLEQSTLNIVYALAHAGKAAGKEPVRPASASEPQTPAGTAEVQPATTGESIEQAPMAEVLKPETQPQGEPTNAIPQPTSMGLGAHAGGDESLGRAGESERVGSEQSSVSQAPEKAAQTQEPIGVSDAIAEIQRRNAPAPSIGKHGVSRAARASANEVDVTPAEHNSAEAHIQRGNKLIADGADPNTLVNEAISRNAWSTDAVDAAIAKDAELTAKARAARRAADADPNMEAAATEAEKAAQAWEDTAIRPIRGQFHETGMSLQSARNLDTGDYIDYSKTFVEKNKRQPTPQEEAVLQKTTRRIRELNAADARDLAQMDRVDGKPKKTLDPKRLREELAALKEKMLADCLL